MIFRWLVAVLLLSCVRELLESCNQIRARNKLDKLHISNFENILRKVHQQRQRKMISLFSKINYWVFFIKEVGLLKKIS